MMLLRGPSQEEGRQAQAPSEFTAMHGTIYIKKTLNPGLEILLSTKGLMPTMLWLGTTEQAPRSFE